jgi:HK97 family phage major capsid protein
MSERKVEYWRTSWNVLRGYVTQSGQMRIAGIVIPFRQIDSYGTWWDEESNIHRDMFSPQPVLWRHGDRRERIGTTDPDTVEQTKRGWYAEMVIDDTELGRHAYELVRSGAAGYSTGSVPHMVAFRTDGYCFEWAWVETSVCPIEEVASPNKSTIALIRSFGVENNGVGPQEIEQRVYPTMDDIDEMVTQRLEQFGDHLLENMPTRSLPSADEEAEQQARTRIEVGSEYDEWSAFDMAVVHQMKTTFAQRSRHVRMDAFDDRFYRALFHKLERLGKRDEERIEAATRKREMGLTTIGRDWRRAVTDELRETLHPFMPYMRANEAHGSTIADYGDKLVPTILGSVAWSTFQHEANILGMLNTFDMPSNPYEIPQITSLPLMRNFAEPTDQTQFGVTASPYATSRITSAKKTFTAGNVGLMLLIPQILVEDSNIMVLQEFAQQLRRGYAWTVNDVLLNADTAATNTNISHYGTDPTGTAYDRYLALDGLRKLATAASDTVATATISADSTITLRQAMGPRGVLGLDPSKLALVVDPGVYYKYLALDDYESISDVGPNATLITGSVGQIKGCNLTVADELENTNASGQIEDSHDATKGSQLMLRPEHLYVGIMRAMQFEQEKVFGADGYAMTVTGRISNVVQEHVGACVYGYNATV